MDAVNTLYMNATINTPQGPVEEGWMLVNAQGRIAAIGGPDLQLPPAADNDTEMVSLAGYSILPGFIDVHVHGGGGFQMMDATYESVDGMSKFHAAHGTTSFLMTTVTDSTERIRQALKNAAAAVKKGVSGAEVLGVHLEGPFLSEQRAGAQDRKHIRVPNIDEMKQYVSDADNLIQLVTLAPERQGGMEAVEWFHGQGITVSIGHSNATYEQVAEAVRRGARHVTHHFNGMSPLHHREPGVAGAGLLMPELTAELIADGIHVHPAVAKLLFDAKQAYHVCIITDAAYCAGLPDGEYGHKKMVGGAVYLLDGSSLAGSSLTMIQALKNMIRFTGYPLDRILPSLTEVPARQIRADDRKGSLTAGKDADFLIVDEQLELHATYVKGRKVYER